MSDRRRNYRVARDEMRVLREAGGELRDYGLRDYGLRIAERGYEALLSLSPNANLFEVRFATHPLQISPALRKSWEKISDQTERVLISAGILTSPLDLEQAVGENLASGKVSATFFAFGLRDKALAFFGERYASLDILGKSQLVDHFQPATWTTLVFRENASLRGAYYQGILYNDTNDI